MHEMFSLLNARKKLIVYCYTGQTAGQTVAALRMLGYDAVSLRGGMGKSYVVFGETLDAATVAGTVIVVGSGLYTLERERRLARRLARDEAGAARNIASGGRG